MSSTNAENLIAFNQRLLDAIDRQNWPAYVELCDPTITAFEPEAVGHLAAGMDFHLFYFESGRQAPTLQSTMSGCNVRLLGDDVAVVAYVRLVQRLDGEGRHATLAFEETRVWQRHESGWRHVHFHRSRCGDASS